MKIEKIVERQRDFFRTDRTRDLRFRLEALERLEASIKHHEEDINQALKKDLHKSSVEAYMTEVGMTLSELSFVKRHLPAWVMRQYVPTPLAQFHATSFSQAEPYGVVLVMSPWNYPFMLCMEPLIGAIAAGNCCVLKPSAYAPATSSVIQTVIRDAFPGKYVAVVEGGRKENTELLEQRFDYIFFTGGVTVGKLVMEKASRYLTPVTLELGGKSPCIVTDKAKLSLAAKRVVFGKFLNSGQTCVAPDYIYCHRSVRDRLIKEIGKQIRRQFGKKLLDNKNYGKIINEKHFDRILGLIDKEKVVFGGNSDRDALRIEPTVMDNVTFSDAVMQEEIFGPLMPILTFDSLDEVIRNVNAMPHPLALYLFTSSKAAAKKVTARCGFGGGCINDTIIHLATTEMGFGGFGESGMGSYHGKTGFDTFTHYKSIVDKKTWLDLPMRYQPYRKMHEKMVRFFLK